MLDGTHSREEAAARGSEAVTHEAVFSRAQGAVAMRARRGESLSTIQDEVIAPSGLSEEHKSALSMRAWGHLEDGRLRYQQRQDQVRRQAGRRRPAQGAE
jgi:hypothetical protein